MRQLCISMRLGTIFGYKDKVWKVTTNDTLAQVFTAVTINGPRETLRIRYRAGQELTVRWTPFTTK